jgi:hypothetical protein
MKGVVVRRLNDGERAEEVYRLNTGIQSAIAGTDPGLEFIERWGKSGAFYCESYCGMRHACKATPVGEVLAV